MKTGSPPPIPGAAGTPQIPLGCTSLGLSTNQTCDPSGDQNGFTQQPPLVSRRRTGAGVGVGSGVRFCRRGGVRLGSRVGRAGRPGVAEAARPGVGANVLRGGSGALAQAARQMPNEQ